MKRSLHPGTFLLVEGVSDKKLFARHVDSEQVKIYVTYGKQNALAVLSILDKYEFIGIAAIVDSDFDRVMNSITTHPNCLNSDFHDAEMMMVLSSAFEKIIGEYADPKLVEIFEHAHGLCVRKILLHRAQEVAYPRWASIANNWWLRFKELQFQRFVDRLDLGISVKALYNSIISRNSESEVDLSDLQSECARLKELATDLRELCNGHDVIAILAIGLRRAIGKNKAADVNVDTLESALRLAFDNTDFVGTALFAAGTAWEHRNPGYRLFK
jgi:hypothetical protein